MLRRPILTEKSMKLAKNGLYTFEVDKNDTKQAIAKLISEKFKVDVIKVATLNIKGKVKSQKMVRKNYQKPSFKKAAVQLKKGQKLPIFETLTKDEEVVVTTAESEQVTLKEKKDILGRTKVRVEKGAVGSAPTTQRKVITGK